jgi:cell division protein FtsB
MLPAAAERPAEGPFLRRMWERRHIRIGPIATAFLIGCALYSLVAGEHGFLTVAALEEQRDRLHAEIAAIETQIAALSERLDEDADDGYVLERTARERYGLARSGEVVYLFDAEALAGTDGAPPASRNDSDRLHRNDAASP